MARMVGFKPINLDPYILATQHSSVAKATSDGIRLSNERLEYLGDSVLDLVVAEVLFKKYPFKDEGFLTDIRSRIVNREVLNEVAKKMGVNKIVEFNIHRKTAISHKSIYGDALEAIVGAVFLDKGFEFCRQFIINRIINPHLDLEKIIQENPNYKSRIIEWAQKQNKEIRFQTADKSNEKEYREFTSQIWLDSQPIEEGHGLTKKKAEQDAAQRSLEKLNLEGNKSGPHT